MAFFGDQRLQLSEPCQTRHNANRGAFRLENEPKLEDNDLYR